MKLVERLRERPRLPRRQGVAAADRRPGGLPGRHAARRSSTRAGTRRPRRSCSSTTSTSASRPRLRADCSCPTSRTPTRSIAVELATALGELTATAREGKTPPADQAGGTFTITNVGVFGVDAGTPILNPGESGILAWARSREQPWVIGNKIKPRWVTTLALSFDHRVVDGEQGSRFLADIASIVEDPGSALLF